jgi:hypothetical protein
VVTLSGVSNHKLVTIWESDVAPKVMAYLDEMGVKWTSINVFRMGEEEALSRVTILIGVKPNSLTRTPTLQPLAASTFLTNSTSPMSMLKSERKSIGRTIDNESVVLKFAGTSLFPFVSC